MSAKQRKERKVIPLDKPAADNVIAFPIPEKQPVVRFEVVETTEEDMKRRLRQFVVILENEARRIEYEKQQKGG